MDKIEMSEKDIYIKKIKNLAVNPIDYRDGTELLKLMDYYGVTSLMDISVNELKEYYEREAGNTTTRTTGSSK